jgi:Putative peptidoglycan binding domain
VIAAPQRHAGPQRRRRALPARCATAFVLALASAASLAPSAAGEVTPGGGTAEASAFDAQGMWVWYVSRSSGGDAARIIARAKRSRVGTVYVKAGDGSTAWSQFSSSLIAGLHAGGLKVCAWQFVYGSAPYSEANVGAGAVAKGADCLIIDAEGQYEGKYASADRYMRSLRSQIGPTFPVSLAGFPYVDYHPAFPYSVFLGPGGAQYNQPQMYWKAIGTSVGRVYAHTYLYNRVFQRPIYPIGQTYDHPGRRKIKKFRRFAISYGASGISWWSWQETNRREWRALGRRVRRIRGFRPSLELPVLQKGSRGDLVVWAQEHLIGAGQSQLPVTGIYGSGTYNAVIGFQQQNGLPADGAIRGLTWSKLLAFTPVSVPWGARQAVAREHLLAVRPAGSTAPLSASLPARRDEIDPGPRP